MPTSIGGLQTIENLLRAWTKKIPRIANMTYWERLRMIKLSSIERRAERYKIIYIYKILENITVNPGIQAEQTRKGRMVKIENQCKIVSAESLFRSSFYFTGPTLFNSLPRYLRDLTGVNTDTFKKHLDSFLMYIPDQPRTIGCHPLPTNHVTGKQSNALCDWFKYLPQTTLAKCAGIEHNGIPKDEYRP